MDKMTVGGRCGYMEPTEDGARQCDQIGVRITVSDELGHLHSIVRCIEHSDWIEAEEASHG